MARKGVQYRLEQNLNNLIGGFKMSLPDPVTKRDKFLHNMIKGTPEIDNIETSNREDAYLKALCANAVPFSQGGLGQNTPKARMVRTYLDVLRRYQLFISYSGESAGTISLGQDYKTFSKIEVYYKNYDGQFSFRAMAPQYSDNVVLDLVTFNEYYTTCKLYSATLTFSEDSATFSDTLITSLKSSETTLTRQSNNGLKIYKIIGYKY